MAIPRILFLTTRNACRGQMAEAWLRHLSNGKVVAISAGTDPGEITPSTVSAMQEVGISLDGQAAKPLDALDIDGVTHVITVCTEAEALCPAFPANVARLHWPIPDPAELVNEFPGLVNDGVRAIRDNIRDRVSIFLLQQGLG